ncbi:MAG: hypothetical protein WBW33_14220, partial [Bryobacteraceae bacterium]
FVRGKEGFRPNALQSFWEMHELSPRSVVEWTNVKQVAVADPQVSESEVRTVQPEPVLEDAEREATNWEEPRKDEPAHTAEGEGNSAPGGEALTLGQVSKKDRPAPSPIVPTTTHKPLLWAVLVIAVVTLLLQAWSASMLRTVAGRSQGSAANPVSPALVGNSRPSGGAANPVETNAEEAQPPPRAVTATEVSGAHVSIEPKHATLKPSETKLFTTQISGTSSRKVVWSIDPRNGGTINDKGVYKAPATIDTPRTVKVTVTSKANLTQSASATVDLVPAAAAAPRSTQQPPPTAKVSANSGPGEAASSTSESHTTSAGANVSLTISPKEATLNPSETMGFSCAVTGNKDGSVEWSIDPSGEGSIDQQGKYQAPSEITKSIEVKVIAKSKADPTKSARATVHLGPP